MLCRDTSPYHTAEIRVAWLVYVRTYCVNIATYFESKQAFSITLFGRRPNKKVDSSFLVQFMDVKSAYVLLPATGNPRTGHNMMDKMTYKFDVVMKSDC